MDRPVPDHLLPPVSLNILCILPTKLATVNSCEFLAYVICDHAFPLTGLCKGSCKNRRGLCIMLQTIDVSLEWPDHFCGGGKGPKQFTVVF